MIKVTLDLDDEIAYKVRQVARSTGRSQAEVLRDAVRLHVGEVERPRPKGIGKHRSGRSDVAENAKQILRKTARPQ